MHRRPRPNTALNTRPSQNMDFEILLKQILDPDYLLAGTSWLKFITDKDKQGLKIIAAVMKHRGQKKFRKRPKESISSLAKQSLVTRSMLRLDSKALEQYQKEYKQSMYKSSYGVNFGRTESDLADTGILSHKKFSELQS